MPGGGGHPRWYLAPEVAGHRRLPGERLVRAGVAGRSSQGNGAAFPGGDRLWRHCPEQPDRAAARFHLADELAVRAPTRLSFIPCSRSAGRRAGGAGRRREAGGLRDCTKVLDAAGAGGGPACGSATRSFTFAVLISAGDAADGGSRDSVKFARRLVPGAMTLRRKNTASQAIGLAVRLMIATLHELVQDKRALQRMETSTRRPSPAR